MHGVHLELLMLLHGLTGMKMLVRAMRKVESSIVTEDATEKLLI